MPFTAFNVFVEHQKHNKAYFKLFLLFFVKIEQLGSIQMYVMQAVHLSGLYRKIWMAQGTNQNASFHGRPLQLVL